MTGLLIFLASLLIFVVLILIARASELVQIVKGQDRSEDNSKLQAALSMGFLILGMIAVIWSIFYYLPYFLQESASEHGVLIDNNFNITLFFTGIVFVATHIMLFYFVYKYRQTKKRKAYYYPDNNKLEVAWTIIPAIVLTFLVVKGMTSWYKITGPEPENSMIIEATGKQFEWIIRYPGPDGELGETMLDSVNANNILGFRWADPSSRDDIIVNEIYLPVNQPVLARIKAQDVLHSFYLPHFRVKMDAVPGIPTRFWFTPTITTEQMREKTGNPDFNYELACAELCGRGHFAMRKVVVVVTQEEYEAWLEKQRFYYSLVMAGQAEEVTPEREDIIEGDTLTTTNSEVIL